MLSELVFLNNKLQSYGVTILDQLISTLILCFIKKKQIKIDFHFVRDQVCRDQLIDALTKPLPLIKFKQVQTNMNVHALPSRLRGHIEDQTLITKDKEDKFFK